MHLSKPSQEWLETNTDKAWYAENREGGESLGFWLHAMYFQVKNTHRGEKTKTFALSPPKLADTWISEAPINVWANVCEQECCMSMWPADPGKGILFYHIRCRHIDRLAN